MQALLEDLGRNVALVLGLMFVFGALRGFAQGRGERTRIVLAGALFGVAAIVSMAAPVHLAPGVIVDMRNVLVALAFVFEGPIAGVIAGSIAAVHRALLGGSGALGGVLLILCVMLVGGYAAHRMRHRSTPSARALLAIGLGISVAGLVLTSLLVVSMPAGEVLALVTRISAPVLIGYPLGALVVGTLLSHESHRREAEHALRRERDLLQRVMSTSPAGIVALDADGRVSLANAQAEQVLGLTPGSDASSVALPLGEVLRTGAPLRASRHELERGERRLFLSIHAAPMRDDDGAIRGVVASVDDVTERVLAEQRLHESQKMEAIGRLAGGIAHDFNNVLGVVLLAAERVEHARSTEEARALGHEIGAAAERGAAFTRQLLAFARKQAVAPRTVDLDAAVGTMLTWLRRLIPESIDLAAELEPGVRWVSIDPSQLEQVVLNLVVNARDAMPRGGRIVIRSRTERVDEGTARAHGAGSAGNFVVLEVHDAGTGMSREVLERVFEPFFTTKDQHGTGLGLAICFGVATQAGGFVDAESRPDEGSTFRLYLPAVTPAEVVSPHARPALADGSERLMLVEDDPALRALVARNLEERGYRVDAFESAEAALAACERALDGAPDLLVTDVILPGRSGPELVTQLRLAWPDLRVLYVSGYTDDKLAREGLDGTGAAVLQKPFSTREVAQAVRRTLDERPT